MTISQGDIARIVQPVIQGEVTSVKFDENTGAKRILLSWQDTDGNPQERWFTEADLEVVTPAGPTV
jgi:hypothetical protein